MSIKLWMVVAMVFGLALAAHAQTSRGVVSGIVADSNGAVVAGATVTLTNTETNLSRTAVTNDAGYYRFDAVDLGTYAISIGATGFGTVTKTNVIVNANQTSSVDAQLEPGGQQVTVDVVSEGGMVLQTETPVRGGNISRLQVTALPFAGRNPVALALTLPGVSTNRGGFGVATFAVNGARGRSNNFLIDGTENNDISVAGQGFQITNPDAVQEVAVQTSNYDSEFGRSGGAVVNTITRSGTKDFHGTLSYLLDSRVDDAITSSESRDPAIVKNGLPFGIENIFSGTFSGPLFFPRFGEGGRSYYDGRERTFFFVAYQEDRQRSNSQVQLTTATAAGRARLRSLFPAGTSANADLLLSATQNAVAVANTFTLALGTVGGVNRGDIEFGTFFRSFPLLSTDKQFQIRVDSRLTESDQFSVRFLSDRQDSPGGGGAGFEGFDTDFSARYYNFLLANTHVFSPVVTNETRLAYNRIQFGFPLADPDGPAGVVPRITVSSISALGVATNLPQGRTANNYVIQNTVTYVKGNHTFRGGVDFLRQIATQSAPFNGRGSLAYNASSGFTAFANFIDNFGGSGNVSRDFGSPLYFPSLYRTALFFQDRWNASAALTLTLGLRYESFGTPFNTLRTPAFTGLFNVNPATRTGPFSEPNKVRADRNNFAPTFGIAYSPSFTDGMFGRLFGDRKTVLRAGYQIGYDSFFNNIASNAASSSPNTIVTTITSTVTAANPRGLPNLSGSFPTTAAPLTPLSAQTLIAPNLVNPYYQRFSLGIQRELPYDLIIDASYVGSKGTKLFINEDANPTVRPELRITPAGFTGATQGRLDNLQGGRTVRTNAGSSIYHSGQLQVRRRFADHSTLTASYTYSKLIDNGSEVFAQGGASSATSLAQTPFIFGGDRLERAVSLFDRTHVASFTYLYEIPLFRRQRGFIGQVLGGFHVSGVTSFESGVPFTVLNGFDADGIGEGGVDRPNFNPNGQRGVRAVPVVDTRATIAGVANPNFGAITGYVNPDAGNAPIDPNTAQFIVNPAFIAGAPMSIPRVGTLGRNTERSPGLNNWNFNILKRNKISETMAIEFRTEFYNIFNHPQYTQSSVSPFSPGGGTVGSNAGVTVAGRFLNANTPSSDGGGRVIRYQLKFIF